MKKKAYVSVLLVALVIVSVVAILVATGKNDLVQAREATERYRRMDLVLADGFAPLFECVSSEPSAGAMGVHYIQPDRFDDRLEVTEPEALVFEPQPDGRRELVAVEYIIPATSWSGGEPPTFLGQALQYKTAVGPHEVDPYYELHAWVWADNPSGMFADWNPEVACPVSPLGGGSGYERSAGDLALRESVSASGVYDSFDGGGTYSRGEAYESAAVALAILKASGDVVGATFSGNDAYDLAADPLAILKASGDVVGASSSGDDAYDPAAGGLDGAGSSDLLFGGWSEIGVCPMGVLWGSC